MRICVKVKPNSREEKVQKLSESEYILWVKAPAKKGKANKAVVELLSESLDITKNRIAIIKGHASKNKIVSIT